MPIRASDLMHRKRDWTTESGLNDLLLGRAGGGAPPVSTRGATLPVGAQSMATRSEIERSSMVHEAAAAAGYSSIPLYVQSLRDDPERLDRLEWTAKFESELMRRLKSVGWDPSNVTAESTAAAFAAIGIPVSGWGGASERRMPTEFKAMSGSAPPSDPGAFVPLPADARAEKTNMPGVSAADRADLQRVIGAGRDIPVDVQRLIESVLAEKEGREPGIGNQGGRGSVTMPGTPRACGNAPSSRTGGLFGMCGIIGGDNPIDPVAQSVGRQDPGRDAPFWMEPTNPCHGLDISKITSGLQPPNEEKKKLDEIKEKLKHERKFQEIEREFKGKIEHANQMLKEAQAAEKKNAEVEKPKAEAAQAAAKAYFNKPGRKDQKIYDALVATAVKLTNKVNETDESAKALIRYWSRQIKILQHQWEKELLEIDGPISPNPNPGGVHPSPDSDAVEACLQSLGDALIQCGFDEGSGGVLDCTSPLIQCGPGAASCPPLCACKSGSSNCAGVLKPNGQGGQTVCWEAGSSKRSDGTGGVGGTPAGCHPCCAYAAGGWGDKCVGVDCRNCRPTTAQESGSICESGNLSPDIFHSLGCGVIDPHQFTSLIGTLLPQLPQLSLPRLLPVIGEHSELPASGDR